MENRRDGTTISVDLSEQQKESRKRRKLSGPVGWFARFLAVGLPVYSFLFLMDFFTFDVFYIYTGAHAAIVLGVVLALVFLLVPASLKAPRDRVPWYDFIFLIIGFVGTFYIVVVYESLIIEGGIGITLMQQILGILTILTLLEAVRRTLGWVMIIVTVFFLIHAKFTYLFPGILSGPRYSWARVLNYIYLSNQGVFGMILDIAATIIISFMTFGAFLETSGVGNTFTKLSLALFGHVRGGPAKVSIFGSAMFGTLTGSPVANVMITGSFTIPLMKRIGYSATFAGAVETAASTGGAIVPPVMGAVAFVLADFTGIGYSRVALAAVLPALLYYLSLYFQLDFRAASSGLVGLPKDELPKLKDVLKEAWILFIPIVVLVIWLMILKEEATRSVFVALGVLIFLGILNPRNRLNVSKFFRALENAGKSMIEITPICAAAGILVGSITLTGLGINLSTLLVSLSHGNLLVLALLAAVAIYIMGMGVAVMATYILMAVLVAPAMIQVGVPLIVAHFFIFYVGVSMFITPPYAPAAYVGASVAHADPMRVGFQSMRLAIVAYLVPFFSLFNPALLWEGTAFQVLSAGLSAIIAVYALSVGFEGFCLTRLKWPERIIWLAGGGLLFVPSTVLIMPGLFVVAASFVYQWRKRKKERQKSR